MATGRVPTTANSPLTAKGDVFTYSTAPARLAVGSNGDTLVADSSTATGLRWEENYAAGKNKIINGNFGVWQRGTSFSNPGDGVYTADRFMIFGNGSGSTKTVSQQTFTPGTAPVAGYEGTTFWRLAQTVAGTGATYTLMLQRIEDVRTFAGQTVTFSAWLKADAARTLTFSINRIYGSGGSSTDYSVATSSNLSVTTSWTRFTFTFSMPSVSGKTIGAGSYLEACINFPNNTAQTIDIWGVQVEDGSVATAFNTATGTLQGELAACQRYYYERLGANYVSWEAYSANGSYPVITYSHPVEMRIAPTVTITGTFNKSGISGNPTVHSYFTQLLNLVVTANSAAGRCYYYSNASSGYTASSEL